MSAVTKLSVSAMPRGNWRPAATYLVGVKSALRADRPHAGGYSIYDSVIATSGRGEDDIRSRRSAALSPPESH